MSKRTKCKYMHTLDGRPATYDKNTQIVFSMDVRLVDSLEEIREQQALSKAWRARKGFRNHLKQGYVRVGPPAQEAE